ADDAGALRQGVGAADQEGDPGALQQADRLPVELLSDKGEVVVGGQCCDHGWPLSRQTSLAFRRPRRGAEGCGEVANSMPAARRLLRMRRRPIAREKP